MNKNSDEKMAEKIIVVIITLVIIAFLFLVLKGPLGFSSPPPRVISGEEVFILTNFPTVFPQGEYTCYPTIGKKIYIQNDGGKSTCERGEVISIKEDFQTYIWFR